MLDIVITIFRTIIHSLDTIINIVLHIPTYILNITNLVALFPPFIFYPLMIIIGASVIIAIKRLII